MTDTAWLTELVRDIPDLPRAGRHVPGHHPAAGRRRRLPLVIDALADEFAGQTIDRVLGIEARGFLFAAPVAYRLGAGLVPVRKPGKLPHDIDREEYELEYGVDLLEIHRDAVGPGEAVLVVDDVLATGGTAAATARLVETPRAAGWPASPSSSSSTPSTGAASRLGDDHVPRPRSAT